MEANLSLKDIVEQELNQEEIDLPIVDTMAVNLGNLLNKEDVAFDELAKVIEKDPALTAKVMNLANSVFYAGLVKVKNVDRAIARVGLMAIRSFLMTVSMKSVFKSAGAHFEERFKLNWQHSLGCAVCCKRIAEHVKLRSIAEDAYMLGLLHDIGTISIFNALTKVSKKQDGPVDLSDNLVNEIIGSFHASVGGKVLGRLNFEERFCRIVELHHNPDDYPDKDDPLFNILYVANNLLKKIGLAFEPDPHVSIISLSASGKLGLDPMFVAMLEVDLEDSLQNMENLL
jgi:HD-like signal output (HDOD) protein